MKKNPAKQYLDSRSRWKAAGKPTRTDEEVRKIFDICKRCDHYQQLTKKLGRCKLCGCALNLGKRLNKLYWSTETCPDLPPRWTAKIERQPDGSYKEVRSDEGDEAGKAPPGA